MVKMKFYFSLIAFFAIFSLGAQTIKVTEDVELEYYHSTYASIYADNVGLADIGYQGYLNYGLNDKLSLNLGLNPSLMANGYNSFDLFIPLTVGFNYGKRGFDRQVPATERFGLFTNVGVGPNYGIVNSETRAIASFLELGIRTRFRGSDISWSFVTLNRGGMAIPGVRVTYGLPSLD